MVVVSLVVAAAVLASVLVLWVRSSLVRLDRLHARVDASEAALDQQLQRRAAAVEQLAGSAAGALPVAAEVATTLRVGRLPLASAERQGAENDVGKAIRVLLCQLGDQPGGLSATQREAVAELREACERVHLSRLLYDDAVRDTRILRQRRLTRLLHLAGHRGLPGFFDIDDTVPPPLTASNPQLGASAGCSRPAGG